MNQPTARQPSHRQRARKARILQQARAIIGEKGIEGLTMRELAASSGVALATLYNLYGSKETLVGIAINDFFEPIVAQAAAKSASKSPLKRLLLLVDEIAANVLDAEAYARVVVALYFRSDADIEVHGMLYSLARKEFAGIMSEMESQKDLLDWVATGLVADEMAHQVMARLHQWCRGDICDVQLSQVMKYGALQILAGACNGALSQAVTKELKMLTRRLAS